LKTSKSINFVKFLIFSVGPRSFSGLRFQLDQYATIKTFIISLQKEKVINLELKVKLKLKTTTGNFTDWHLKMVLAPRAWTVSFVSILFILVTRRVKWYSRFIGKNLKGTRKRFRPYEVYIYRLLEPIRFTHVGLSFRMTKKCQNKINLVVKIIPIFVKLVSEQENVTGNKNTRIGWDWVNASKTIKYIYLNIHIRIL